LSSKPEDDIRGTETVQRLFSFALKRVIMLMVAFKNGFEKGGRSMNEMTFKRNELLAQQVIKGLVSRNMSGYYAASREEALKLALSLIPEGSTVTMGGAMSAHEIGLPKALTEGNYNFIDRDRSSDKAAAMRAAYDADFYLSSANAITEDGVMINIDGNSNRVSAIAQGPKKVLFIVGMNKVCPDVDSAMKRARNVAAPINAQRFNLNTPCCKTGSCMDCKSPDTICCQFLITRYSRHKDRIHVILVNDELGF
jgi:L-lactate utilization protein LutB